MRLLECTDAAGRPITINVEAMRWFAPKEGAPDCTYVSFGRNDEAVLLRETFATFKERLNAMR